MNILHLRASLPPRGNSVLAHRLRTDITPLWWLPAVVKWGRIVLTVWFSVQFTRGLIPSFGTPIGLGTLACVLVGIAVFFGLDFWLSRYDPRVLASLSAWVRPVAPLTAEFRDWNDLTTRLAGSDYAVRTPGEPARERDHIFLGAVNGTRWPLLFDISKPRHVLLTGATASGKTHRVLLPAAVQILRRRTASVVVIDLKGDKAMFMKLATEARRLGVNFRWVNLDTGSSYVFNPLTQRFFERLNEDAQVQLIAQSLGLDGQGRQEDVFFSDLNERTLRRFFRAGRPRSLRQLLGQIEQPGAAGNAEVTAREWELAMHLRSALDRLSQILALNAEAVGPGVTAEMLDGAVELDDVLCRPQVVYFWLPTSLQRTTSRAVARLANQALVSAARSYVGNRVPVHVFLDEAQEAVGTAAIDGMLRQARDFGLSYWLTCQQLSALRAGQHDCLDAITGNVALQMHFSATDRTGHEHLIRLSGESSRWLYGEADTADGVRGQRREAVGTRLTAEDVAHLNSVSGLAATLLTPRTPLSPFRHIFFLRTGYAMSAREYQRYRLMPFPLPTRFTVYHPGAEPRRVAPPAAPQQPARPVGVPRVPAEPARPSPRPSRPPAPIVSPPNSPPAAGNRADAPPKPPPSVSDQVSPPCHPTGEPQTDEARTKRHAKRAGGRVPKSQQQPQPRAEDTPPSPNPDLAKYLEQLRLADALPPEQPPSRPR
jgi:hypothetical protein